MAVSSQMEVLNTGSTVESPKELQSVKSGSGVGFGHWISAAAQVTPAGLEALL